MDADFRILAAKLETGFAALKEHVGERLEDLDKRGDKRHEENQKWLSKQDDKLASIEVQTIKTNGRLSNAENDIASLKSTLRNSVKGITLKDISIWIAIIGGSFWVLVNVFGYQR